MPVPVQGPQDGYAQSNSGDTELYSEVLRVCTMQGEAVVFCSSNRCKPPLRPSVQAQTKSFYIDLKENARGKHRLAHVQGLMGVG